MICPTLSPAWRRLLGGRGPIDAFWGGWSGRGPTVAANSHVMSSLRLRRSRGSVLAFGTQVRGFKPDRSRWIFQGEKILSTPSFGGEVKPSVPCRRFTACKRSLNLRGSRAFSGKIHRPFLAHVVPPLAAAISWRRPVAKVGTFENKKVHKHLHLWPLGPHRSRLAVRSGTSKGSTISQYGCSTFGALATEGR